MRWLTVERESPVTVITSARVRGGPARNSASSAPGPVPGRPPAVTASAVMSATLLNPAAKRNTRY